MVCDRRVICAISGFIITKTSWFRGTFFPCPQGVSSFWWNYRHFQHHAKPNVVSLVVSKKVIVANISAQIREVATASPCSFWRTRTLRFRLCCFSGRQYLKSGVRNTGANYPTTFSTDTSTSVSHRSNEVQFSICSPSHSVAVGPPLLLPVYFHVEVVYYTLKMRKWKVCSFNSPKLTTKISISFLHRIWYACSCSIIAFIWCTLLYWVGSGQAFAGTSLSDSWRATGLSGALRPTISPWILTWTSARTGFPCSWPAHVMWRDPSSMIGLLATSTIKLNTSESPV